MSITPAQPVPYAGVATRAVALAIDAALAQLIVVGCGAVVALVASLADVQFGSVAKWLAAAAWVLIVAGYFMFFWTTAGQTPGMRLLGLRVIDPDGKPPSPRRSLVRVVGLGLAIIPMFAGFLPVLVDDRRRALQDYLAHTVVIYDYHPDPSLLNERTAHDTVGVRTRGSTAGTAP